MNSNLNERDKKLLEVAVNKINDKMERLNKLKYVLDDKDKIRDIELKKAGLRIATNIISDMVRNSDEDFFKVDIEKQVIDFITEMNQEDKSITLRYKYDKEEGVYFIYHDYINWNDDIEFQRLIGKLLKEKFYKRKIFNVCVTHYSELLN